MFVFQLNIRLPNKILNRVELNNCHLFSTIQFHKMTQEKLYSNNHAVITFTQYN